MASNTQRASQKHPKAKPTLVKLDAPTRTQPLTSSQKRLNPLKAYNLQSSSALQGLPSQSQPTKKRKGKEKAAETPFGVAITENGEDDRLWVDIYEPTTEAELAVHVRKVEDVRRWFVEAFEGGPSGKLRRYRRILVLTGPSGAGKTATVRVLARELGFEILEWRNATGLSFSSTSSSSSIDHEEHESILTQFEVFLNRATSCRSLFSEPSASSPSSQGLPRTVPPKFNSEGTHIILLEDLPNILHLQTQTRFHAALRSFVDHASNSITPIPVVIVLSDATVRGDTRDDLLTSGVGWGRDKNDILDIRTALPRDLLGGPYVTQIAFNPIAPTLMKKALIALVDRHFSVESTFKSHLFVAPSKEIIDLVVESSNGDIRSAIMALQFSCIKRTSEPRGKKQKAILGTITRRESSLALFHLIGKVMYNKRKADPPSSTASAKDIKKERELDEKLGDPPKLPSHLRQHERRASRVDVDALYADSPIDSSLFSLYIHQNYTQFCNELAECEGVIDWLSWIDSSGGEAWYQANPHRFHLLTLGTLHSLPSPVVRRSQKVYKPDYFEHLNKEKDAWEAVGDTWHWMIHPRASESPQSLTKDATRWSKREVALELGAVLRLKGQNGMIGRGDWGNGGCPASHSLFSRLAFTKGDAREGQQVDEVDVMGEEEQRFAEDELYTGSSAHEKGGKSTEQDGATGGWLESDDIEEF